MQLDVGKLKSFLTTVQKQTSAQLIRDVIEHLELTVSADLKVSAPLFTEDNVKVYGLEVKGTKENKWNVASTTSVHTWLGLMLTTMGDYVGPVSYMSSSASAELAKFFQKASPKTIESGIIAAGKGLIEGQIKGKPAHTFSRL